MSSVQGIVPSLRRVPVVSTFLRRRYARRFPTVAALNCFSGVYPTFEEAARHVPSGAVVGYDHLAAARLYHEFCERLRPTDYPALYWLREALREDTRDEPAHRVFDLGGHVGVLYYASRPYLTAPDAGRAVAAYRWTVCDVPAVVREGVRMAQSRESAGLDFTTDRGDADGATVLLASGALQYIAQPIDELVASLVRRPRHLLIHKTPTHATREFFTLQNIGVAICPYRIASRTALPASLERLGYELVDTWEDPTRATSVPYAQDADGIAYSGFYLRLR